ncbi:LysR family transcriptional regulator [Catenuloplanes atrovinosus]|uniref:DNA-binding transcriptional LysR family regulator n=1 Tax=Catenuloplanes atrovinosus TaxID=137266 RepID=A0AAE3YJB2_9ACTN|nr:LysR family transcriptional regulator [Catenuloplanes atrovinosus]MDR7274550.1 DNA-binding transcriptional LysR family regulator [Catenuloplanes atrovinosus]
METRELRYFVAVAEESHYGRAAARLGIAQPALTRTVQKLERRLGTPLFVRSGRTVSLTPAGSVLLREGRNALDAVEAADRRTRRAGRAEAERPGIALATKAGVSVDLLAALLDAYAAEPGAVPVDVVPAQIGEPERMLRDGRADVALLHLPDDDPATGLDREDIATEGVIVVLPGGHPLAARPALTLAELPDLPRPRWPRTDGSYPDGPGPAFLDSAQLFQLIALGRACAVLPESARPSLPRGVAAVPVTDAAPLTVHLVWPAHSRSRDVAALVRVATRLR